MCGIAGMLGCSPKEETVEKMLQTMKRRGPDNRGSYGSEDCTLLHSRLTIIDSAGGKQPMILDWAGERYVLVYNGELYNTRELRQELQLLGHSFSGYSDTEVLLHGYAQWGREILEKSNGIFAFAVWEEKARRLFLARDRIGVKPLFYYHHNNVLAFSSEIKTLFCIPQIRPIIDRQGAMELILLGPGRKPGSGVFRNIRELEPGCCACFEYGNLRIQRYWKLRDGEYRDTIPETVEKVRWLVLDAIKRQMVSDVPVGTFLSGGLDSSIITTVCAESYAQQGEILKTFSVDYQNNDRFFSSSKFQPDSDGAYIRLMQSRLNTDHHWTVLDPEDLENCLEDATIARDLPGMADVDFSLLAFCREIRKNVKVALSGECADEIFGGYPWYRDPEVRMRKGFPWAQNTMDRILLLHAPLRAGGEEFVDEVYNETLRESDILPGISDTERRMKEMMNLNFRWFMQTLLDRKDRMSMYSGLEVRVPFCDYRIAEYLYRVPWEVKEYGGREKGLLRVSMEGILPQEILQRKKSPYPKTFDPRYEYAMSARLEKLLLSDSPLLCLIDRKALQEYLDAVHFWPWYGQLMGRAQTIAYFLQLDFWMRHYAVDVAF